jgi:quercetin dioxygenase-like cupin family protein
MNVRAIAAVLAPCLAALVYAAPVAAPRIRLTPVDIAALQAHAAGTGTSGVAGIRTTVLAGDPAVAGPYTISVSVPAHTTIAVHTHRDNRTAVVVSGVWYFGYNDPADPQAARALPAGSFYSEPAGVAHFAQTKDQAVVVYITGFGPSDTVYVNTADDPRRR